MDPKRKRFPFALTAAILAALILMFFVGCGSNMLNPAATHSAVNPSPSATAPIETESSTDLPPSKPTEHDIVINVSKAEITFEGSIGDAAHDYAKSIDQWICELERLLGEISESFSIRVCEDLEFIQGAPELAADIEQLESGELTVEIARAMSDHPEWVIRGAAYSVMNDINIVKLSAAYRTSNGDYSALSLSPIRFAKRYNDEKALRDNAHTAAALLHFIIDKYGEIKLDNLKEDKSKFLAEMIPDAVYDYPYDGEFDSYYYEYDRRALIFDEVFPIAITGEFGTIYAQPLRDCKNAAELEKLLHDFTQGLELMRKYVDKNSAEYRYICTDDATADYYMIDNFDNSYAYKGIVALNFDAAAILHETIHQWLFPLDYDHWYYEGLADYLSIIGNNGKTLELAKSNSRHALMYPDIYGGHGVADINNTPAEYRVEGDHLTYDQSCTLIAYIVEAYTLDPIFAVCAGMDFESAFDKPFTEVYDEWVAWIG